MPNDPTATPTELHWLTIADAARLIETRRLSPVELTDALLARIEALAAQNLGTSAVPQLANSTLDLVVHVVALPEGGARIVEITEVKLDNSNHLATDPVLVWRSEGSRRGGQGGKMQIIGVSSRLAATVAASGGSLPSNLIRK